MKSKAIIPLLLGLGIGIATVKLAVDTIRKAQAANRPATTVRVVRAREDIAAHAEITAAMVEVVETVDSLFAPANERIETIEEVVGRVSAKAVPEGAAILKRMLAPKGTRPGMVGQIPPGYRAVSVKIDEVTGVAYQIQPGDWVDVIVVMDIASSTRGKKETIAEVILQHVQVAAIGNTTSAQSAGSIGKARPAKSATLLVREADVPKLHLAGTRGKITLAMRGGDDVTMAEASSATMGDVLSGVHGPWDTPKKSNASAPQRPISSVPPRWTEPKRELPHLVLVMRGTSGGRMTQEVERITFATRNSPRVLDITAGPPSAAASTIGTPTMPNPAISSVPVLSSVEDQSEMDDGE